MCVYKPSNGAQLGRIVNNFPRYFSEIVPRLSGFESTSGSRDLLTVYRMIQLTEG